MVDILVAVKKSCRTYIIGAASCFNVTGAGDDYHDLSTLMSISSVQILFPNCFSPHRSYQFGTLMFSSE